MREELKRKQGSHSDFYKKYKIDFDVLLDPSHVSFNIIYAFKDEKNDDLLDVIKLQHMQRTVNIGLTFLGYHLVKTVMWRYGYGANFFYRTRLLSIPVALIGVWYSSTKVYPRHLQEAGLMEYAKKRNKFNKDMGVLKKFMASRKDFIRET